jgi:hypothetical protein
MNDQRILDVTLPLTPQHQIEYFKDKSILFRVDIASSKITPKQCFMTLSNMKIKAEIKDVTPELITEYMTGNFVVETTNMAQICANIILGYKHQRTPYLEVEDQFSLEEYTDYIIENQGMIEKWCKLISSIPLYLITSTKYLSEEEIDLLKTTLPREEGRLPELGVNISQVLALPDFLTNYFSIEEMNDISSQTYYPHYFDEYIYGGDRLISFLASPKQNNYFATASLNLMQFLKHKESSDKILTHDQE